MAKMVMCNIIQHTTQCIVYQKKIIITKNSSTEIWQGQKTVYMYCICMAVLYNFLNVVFGVVNESRAHKSDKCGLLLTQIIICKYFWEPKTEKNAK